VTISSAIQAAQSGLRITGQKADVVATNVSNSTTAGYVRRSLDCGGEHPRWDQSSLGSAPSAVARAGDEALSAERSSLGSDLSQADLFASTWNTISDPRRKHGRRSLSLFGLFSNFESAFSNLAMSPESGSDMTATLQAASLIRQGVQRPFRFRHVPAFAETDHEIANGVDTVNCRPEGRRGHSTPKLARIDPSPAARRPR
jgi:flagellar hook-associated protein 1 FlgK